MPILAALLIVTVFGGTVYLAVRSSVEKTLRLRTNIGDIVSVKKSDGTIVDHVMIGKIDGDNLSGRTRDGTGEPIFFTKKDIVPIVSLDARI